MKKNANFLLVFSFLAAFLACKNENPVQSNANSGPSEGKPTAAANPAEAESPAGSANSAGSVRLWADQVESGINLTVPEDWTPEDFNTIYKNINRKAIYSDIVDAVLTGKQKAYDFFNDSVLTLDNVKSILAKPNHGANDISLIRIREKLSFDKENFKLQTEPNCLILYVNHLSNGELHGYEPLFYVHIK